MDPQVQSTIFGGVIAAVAGFAAWLLGAVTSVWLAKTQRSHERREKRYDDVKAAFEQFYSTMHAMVHEAELDAYNEGGTYADQNAAQEPITHLLAADGAETALAHLRLFADERLFMAGREWLDAYYARFWGEVTQNPSIDTHAAENKFVDEGKRSLGIAK